MLAVFWLKLDGNQVERIAHFFSGVFLFKLQPQAGKLLGV
jgi:hypothetical protein